MTVWFRSVNNMETKLSFDCYDVCIMLQCLVLKIVILGLNLSDNCAGWWMMFCNIHDLLFDLNMFFPLNTSNFYNVFLYISLYNVIKCLTGNIFVADICIMFSRWWLKLSSLFGYQYWVLILLSRYSWNGRMYCLVLHVSMFEFIDIDLRSYDSNLYVVLKRCRRSIQAPCKLILQKSVCHWLLGR